VREVLAAEDSAVRALWQPVRVEVSDDGRWGYSQGYRTALVAGALATDSYVAVWRRGGDDRWQLAAYAEMGARPPADASLPAALAGAVVAAPPATPDAAAPLLDADRAFAATSAASDPGSAFGKHAAPDVMVFGAGGVLVLGPDALQAGFGPPSADNTLAWYPVAGGIAGSGELGFTVGLAVARGRAPDGTAVERPSKYITVWRRQPDGRWAFVTDGGNERPADGAERAPMR
jgi:ketosteroid isomerase-like protein